MTAFKPGASHAGQIGADIRQQIPRTNKFVAPGIQHSTGFSDKQVASEQTDPGTGKATLVLAPQKRPMTVRDLLRHTSGLVYPSTQTRPSTGSTAKGGSSAATRRLPTLSPA
jgi:CubicO group peptidase (beta-lactamase class C family)